MGLKNWLNSITIKYIRIQHVIFTLILQKSRVLQIQRLKGAAVVIYCKPLTMLEMRCHRLSRRVNNMAVFHWFQYAIWSSSQQNS